MNIQNCFDMLVKVQGARKAAERADDRNYSWETTERLNRARSREEYFLSFLDRKMAPLQRGSNQ